MVLGETLFVAVPAIILGTIFGILALWILLGVSVFAGSVAIAISVPAGRLILAMLCWIFGIIIVRILTIQIALFTPMTGRMTMQAGNARRTVKIQRAVALAMPVIFCAAVLLGLLESVDTYRDLKMFEAEISYFIDDLNVQGTTIDDNFF